MHWFIRFLILRKYRIYRHTIILLYILLMIFVFGGKIELNNILVYHRLMWMMYILTMIYFNMYVLIPKLLFQRKYITYFFSLPIVTFISYLIVRAFRNEYFKGLYIIPNYKVETPFSEVFIIGNLLLLLIFTSSAIKIFQKWAIDSYQMHEMKQNTIKAELKALKDQINPHFLFNMLNNINTLILSNPQKAISVVMKLSGFLRHLLYENNDQTVLLEKEIQFTQDFLDLEKLRRDDFNSNVLVSNDSIPLDKIRIPPNLFIIFIENAAKYSLDSDNLSEIMVKIEVEKGTLCFKCYNTTPNKQENNNPQGGLGLTNIKNRLQLLYGDNYQLEIISKPGFYTVIMKVPLNINQRTQLK